MLENIGLLSLAPGAPSSLSGLENSSDKSSENGSKNTFNRLFHNNLSGNFSGRVELVDAGVSPLSAASIGEQMAAAFGHNSNSLESGLGLPIALPQGGSPLPASGKSLPALAGQIEALGELADAALQKLISEPSLTGDSASSEIESALRKFVEQLDQLATTLNSALEELPDTLAAVPALSDIADTGEGFPPALPPLDEGLLAEIDSAINSAINSAVAALRELTATLSPSSAVQVPVGASLNDKRASDNALLASGAEKTPNTGGAVLPAVEAATKSASALLQVVLQRAETIAATVEQAVTALGDGTKASFAAASVPVADALLRNQFAAKAADHMPAFAQEPILPAQSNALNALANAATHGAAVVNSAHSDLLSASLSNAALQNPAASNPAIMAATQLPAAANVASSASGHAVAEQPFTAHIGLPLDNSRWGDQFAQRVAWLAGQGLQSAQIHLNPAELGPMQVRIDSHEDSAKVVFTTTHVSTRENIEANLPRLRDLFAAQGLDLLDVDVEQHNPQSEGQSADNDAAQKRDGEIVDSGLQALNGDESGSATQHVVQLHYGLIDAFA